MRFNGRPTSPVGLILSHMFAPAPELQAWVAREIISDAGGIHNPDHAHLDGADLEFLWAYSGFTKASRTVLGQAEQVMFRAGGWQKARQEQQFTEWFGRVPAFLITLDAAYCRGCSDADFCALIGHEMYHIAQTQDAFGAPVFTKDGRPKLAIRGHDVEEFVGVVRRYGASDQVKPLVQAALGRPEVAALNIARACGCCLKTAA
jgi:hypothetical protein